MKITIDVEIFQIGFVLNEHDEIDRGHGIYGSSTVEQFNGYAKVVLDDDALLLLLKIKFNVRLNNDCK